MFHPSNISPGVNAYTLNRFSSMRNYEEREGPSLNKPKPLSYFADISAFASSSNFVVRLRLPKQTIKASSMLPPIIR